MLCCCAQPPPHLSQAKSLSRTRRTIVEAQIVRNNDDDVGPLRSADRRVDDSRGILLHDGGANVPGCRGERAASKQACTGKETTHR